MNDCTFHTLGAEVIVGDGTTPSHGPWFRVNNAFTLSIMDSWY